jgi:hypothetical protein
LTELYTPLTKDSMLEYSRVYYSICTLLYSVVLYMCFISVLFSAASMQPHDCAHCHNALHYCSCCTSLFCPIMDSIVPMSISTYQICSHSCIPCDAPDIYTLSSIYTDIYLYSDLLSPRYYTPVLLSARIYSYILIVGIVHSPHTNDKLSLSGVPTSNDCHSTFCQYVSPSSQVSGLVSLMIGWSHSNANMQNFDVRSTSF